MSFGSAVSISGDGLTVLIAAHQETVNEKAEAGAAYIFSRPTPSSSAWTQQKKLTADPEAYAWFGSSVALSQDGLIALIGARKFNVDGQQDSGVAFIFAKSSSYGEWMQQMKLKAGDGTDVEAKAQFGCAVALSATGSLAIVGALREVGALKETHSNVGAAYLFARKTPSSSIWLQQEKLTASSDYIQDDAYFGSSVALSADGLVAMVGAFGETVDGLSTAGAVFVFSRSSDSSTATWTQEAHITAFEAQRNLAYAYFGQSVALANDGATALVGAPQHANGDGYAVVFRRRPTTSAAGNWTVDSVLLAGNNGTDRELKAGFGITLSMAQNGLVCIVGAGAKDSATAADTGAAYVYSRPSVQSTRWTLLVKLTTADAMVSTRFGRSVAITSTPDAEFAAVVGTSGIIQSAAAAYVVTNSPPSSSSSSPTSNFALPSPGLFGVAIGVPVVVVCTGFWCICFMVRRRRREDQPKKLKKTQKKKLEKKHDDDNVNSSYDNPPAPGAATVSYDDPPHRKESSSRHPSRSQSPRSLSRRNSSSKRRKTKQPPPQSSANIADDDTYDSILSNVPFASPSAAATAGGQPEYSQLELKPLTSPTSPTSDGDGVMDPADRRYVIEASEIPADRRYVIGPSEIEREQLLGAGNFGEVWKCDWKGVPVAVKVVKGVDAGARKQLELEASRFQALPNHPNVITFYGLVLDPLSIVIEFAPGGALDEALYGSKRRAFTDQQSVEIVRGVALGVAHLHDNSVIHRDLAARNVLLGHGDQPKITDFGMSRESMMDNEQHQQQQTVTRLGPIKWMAPEQMSDQVVSQESDVFALGVLMFEVFARSLPWTGHKNVEVAQKVMQGESLAVPAGCPPLIAETMQSCFQFDSKRRPTARHIAKTLSAQVKKQNQQTLSSKTEPPTTTTAEDGYVDPPKQ